MKMTMGSLFDGSGGFPLAGTLGGIETLWTSEIEPFPIRVTTKRFPNAKHYGDISKLNGAELEPVDIITGGSPCQSLSVAGKREGMKRYCPECGYQTEAQDEETRCPLCDTELKYTRSGLFMEQIRVIKEMRRATNGKQPRFMLWENVPGAFSSNKGQDFKAVLEETIGVKREISLPRPPKDKWQNAGCIVGDGYSVAWRVVDAQYCGVPQRRRRIVLIADFGGECAGEILFERYSLRGNFAQSEDKRERTAGDTADSFGAADSENETVKIINLNKGDVQSKTILDPKGICPCLYAGESRYGGGECYVLENHPNDSRVKIDETGTVQSLTSRMGTGGGNVPLVMEQSYRDSAVYWDGSQTCGTLTANNAGGNQRMPDKDNFNCVVLRTTRNDTTCYNICSYASNSMKSDNPHSGVYQTDKSRTLDLNGGNPTCNQGGTVIVGSNITYALDRAKMGDNQTSVAYKTYQDKVDALCARDYKGVGNQYVGENKLIVEPQISDNGICHKRVARGPSAVCAYPEYIVRRLTPLECCRLQGFPDWWTDDLETPEPTEEDIAFWRDVFETHSQVVNGKPSTKTDKQIIKWLQNPYSDSAEYKMWGNGIALPCMARFLCRIPLQVQMEQLEQLDVDDLLD